MSSNSSSQSTGLLPVQTIIKGETMKQIKTARKERAEKIKRFTAKNRLFILLAIVCCFYLIGTTVFGKEQEPPRQDAIQTETVQQEPEHWRFYWIDIWVLAVGGGFCTVMMIREKKKAKEEIK